MPPSVPEETPLNGTSKAPYYVWGHNPNSIEKVDADLDAGANGLEPDITVADDSPCTATDTTIGDLVDWDSSSPYRDGACSDTHFEDWLDHVHMKASQPGSKLGVIAFDIKSSAADATHAAAILTAIRSHLTFDLPDLTIILSVGSLDDAKNAFDGVGIPPGTLGAKEAVQVDGESDAKGVWDYFTGKGYTRFTFGDGGLVDVSESFPRAHDHAVFLRASTGYPLFDTYVFLQSEHDVINSFIHTGVQGVIVGTKDSFLSPSDPTQDPPVITDVIDNVVQPSAQVSMALPTDDPLNAGLPEAYGLEMKTDSSLNSGTDGDLKFTLNGCKGSAYVVVNTGSIRFNYDTKRMKDGNTDYVTIPSVDLGKLASVTIYNDGTGIAPGWSFDYVRVSSARWLGNDSNNDHEYQANTPGTVDAWQTVTLPLVPNFTAYGAPGPNAASLPDVLAQCAEVLPAAPTATDSCGSTIVGTPNVTGPFAEGDVQITWSFPDVPANTTYHQTQWIHVHDTMPPMFVGPPPAPAEDAMHADGTVVNYPLPAATDNCPAANSAAPVTCNPPPGSLFPIGTTPVTCTTTDKVGNATTIDFDLVVRSPLETHQHVLAQLNPLATTPNLASAIRLLTKSVDPALWADPSRLKKRKGDRVFGLDMAVIGRLLSQMNRPPSPVSVEQFQEFSEALAQADRVIAEIAIADAKANKLDPARIAKAEQILATTDAVGPSIKVAARSWRQIRRARPSM